MFSFNGDLPMSNIPRKVIQGVQTLLYPDGPYMEVAERVRILHKLGKNFRLLQAETLNIRNYWIYRVTIMIDDHQYIGDAEIHFGASKETPDGTNPITCGHTSALGNALTFAGYGDLRLLLERQQLNSEEGLVLYPTESPYGEIEGIRIVWLDETPYVAVDERLYHLHRLGHTLRMERCEIIRVHGIWVYRVALLVDERRYIADAEVHFAAPATAPERRFPISTAQTSAVGNALALAGFGDVHTLLDRMGKDVGPLHWTPALASANAVSQAQRQRLVSNSEQEAPLLMTEQQRQTLRDLCTTLGEPEPEAMDDWTREEAETYIEVLRMQINDLLETADEARTSQEMDSAKLPHPAQEVPVSSAEIGELKRSWMQAFNVQGTPSAMKQQWEAFKQQYCHEAVDDRAMRRSQYTCLKEAIDQQRSRSAMQQSSRANGHVAKQ
jgi:hypothetical protein